MTTYYILRFDIPDDPYNAENMDISDEAITDDYLKGVSFKHKRVAITLHKNRGTLYHNIFNLFCLPIVSEQIKDVIQKNADSEVECYPVNLTFETHLKYYFINILNRIDAIDYQHSVYEELIPDMKVFKSVEKLVLLEDKLANYDIFRLEHLAFEIVISDAMKQALDALNIPEITFIPVSKFTWD